MVFDDDVFYSLKPKEARRNTWHTHNFYSKVSEPPAILGLLLSVIFLCGTKIFPMLKDEYLTNYPDAHFMTIMFGATFVIGGRLIHSIYWAKRDYTRIKFGIGDVLIFSLVILFTSGILFVIFVAQPLWLVGIYAVLCSFGIYNFIDLRTKRIPANPKTCDIPIELRIQTINILMFSAMFVNFVVTSVLLVIQDQVGEVWLCISLTPIFVIMMINTLHSHQLSAWPKLLVNNEYVTPSKLQERLDAIVGLNDTYFRNNESVRSEIERYKEQYKLIYIRRARLDEVETILDLYFYHFEYVFVQILSPYNLDYRDLMRKMLLGNYGLGDFGYLRFYIIEDNGAPCGMLLPEFHLAPRFYSHLGKISLAIFLMRKIGRKGFLHVIRNTNRLRALEPKPELEELRIAYIALRDDQQRTGIGSGVLRLLTQAYIESSVNGFQAQVISAYVREQNVAAIRLFETSGYKRSSVPREESDAIDPFKLTKGSVIRFEFKAE